MIIGSLFTSRSDFGERRSSKERKKYDVDATASICRALNDVSFYLFYDKEDEIECREKIVYVKNETKQLRERRSKREKKCSLLPPSPSLSLFL